MESLTEPSRPLSTSDGSVSSTNMLGPGKKINPVFKQILYFVNMNNDFFSLLNLGCVLTTFSVEQVSAADSIPRLLLFKIRGMLSHGGLYRWRENSFSFFLYQKLKEILVRYIRIILTASKDRSISKI